MKVYLAQHAKAVDKNVNPERPISDEGRSETQAIADSLKKSGISIERIIHSGKLRAVQTAEIFAKAFQAKVLPTEGMAPNDSVERLTEKIIEPSYDKTLFVGHLPQMQKVVSFMLNGDESQRSITFYNSSVVCMSVTNEGASIDWYATPTII